MLERALARCPLWPLLSGLLLGIFLGDYLGTNGWLATCLIGLLLSLAFRKLPVRLLTLGLVLGHGFHGQTISNQRQWVEVIHKAHSPQLMSPPRVQISGVILDTGSSDRGPYLVKITNSTLEQNNQPLPSGVRIILDTHFRPYPPLEYGERLEVNGLLHPIEPLRNPHGFDQAAWRHRQGADLILKSRQPITRFGITPSRRIVHTMSQWKDHLRDKMTAGLEQDSEEAQLIRAVVLGERPPRTSGMITDFRNSGTLHVFAVSGLHVGMVGSILALLFWLTRAPRRFIIVFTILGMAIYAGITGLNPPAVRAVIMATVFLSGFLINRRPTLINSLAFSAVVVLLWDSHQLFTPGFQLSYGVLLTIALLSRFWGKLFKPIATLDPFMPRVLLTDWQERRLSWREWLQGALSVSSAAWMGSTPLMWIHFGIITPIAIIAGIPLMLMVFVILGLAMASMAIGSLWSSGGEAINQVNAMVARYTHGTASSFAHLPVSHINRRPGSPKGGQIIVFDLPDGGASHLIDIGDGVLLDSGRSDHFHYHVLPTLSYLQIQPQSLIVSHADSKHTGAMAQCLTQFRSRQALIPRADQRSPSFKQFLTQAHTTTECAIITPHLGDRFPLSSTSQDVYLEILHAPAELDGRGLADDTGLVIRLHWHGWKILFTGDAGLTTEARMLDSKIDLKADVIIMGRHANDFTGHQAFYDAVAPRAIISSSCHFPDAERIPTQWRRRITEQGITLFDQQQSGAVTLTIENGDLLLTPMLSTTAPYRIKR